MEKAATYKKDAGLENLEKSLDSPLTMIDLFAGCGGLSLGFEQQNFMPLLFSEINLHAAQTYMENRKGHDIIPVGDVYSLTDDNLRLMQHHWANKGIDDVDVICGGPPCQGFSGIGHRRTFKLDKEDIPSNHLFLEMVRIIKFVRPKVFLFENVRGLLTGRWTKSGNKGEIFKEVLAAFKAIEGYECEWDLVHAKEYGVPQNRPRVLLIGYRKDVLKSDKQTELFEVSEGKEGPSPYMAGGLARKRGFLPQPIKSPPPSLDELLSDLIDPEYDHGGATCTYPEKASTDIQKLLRRLPNGSVAKKGAPLTEHEYSSHSEKVVEKFNHMLKNQGKIADQHQTKKFAQRLLPREWQAGGPNITATSLPDDYVHFEQARVPTVREWARIQTFPDWYNFRGPRTTGGRRRAGDPNAGLWERDVPKYTQIGNAVPVLLAVEVAKHIRSIIREK